MAAASPVGAAVAVRGRPQALKLYRPGRRRSILSLDLVDDSGSVKALFFNQPWQWERLRALQAAGREVVLAGKIGRTRSGTALLAPSVESEGAEDLAAPTRAGASDWTPVYPTTEGLGQPLLRRLVEVVLEGCVGAVRESLTPHVLSELELPPLPVALRDLHRPHGAEAFLRARRRVGFERLLALQARLVRSRRTRAEESARAVELSVPERAELVARLPFRPTDGQARVLGEILDDLARQRPMRRLLQGEVGAGKTLVALAACAAVARAGGQAALLAPTELLAEQHAAGLVRACQAFGVRTVLLTGSLRAAERRAALAEISAGRAGLAIGTHALFSADVRFARLDLAVIDEQQRFGVAQKRALLDKGHDVHALLMTATPIPRTLALCFYGDLEVSLLAERPPGRGTVETHVVEPDGREGVLRFLRERLELGERAFWVCPRIETDEDEVGEDDEGREQVAGADEAWRRLRGGPLGPLGVERVHGRIPAAERAASVERLREGRTHLLVGTSIVEVGVDVPEATVMVIEGAERFGLAQLHQLRGRVGRSPRPSWCFLLGTEASSERLRFLEECTDGFAIAEEDLRRRGMGDLAGARQAGENLEGLGGVEVDARLVERAREIVREGGGWSAGVGSGDGRGELV
jgi:ATP-dependent DNA helicase RecG